MFSVVGSGADTAWVSTDVELVCVDNRWGCCSGELYVIMLRDVRVL